MARLFDRADIDAVVAEVGGQIVGSNFLWAETSVAGIRPLTVALPVRIPARTAEQPGTRRSTRRCIFAFNPILNEYTKSC